MFEEARHSPPPHSPRTLAQQRQCRRVRPDAGCPCMNALYCRFRPDIGTDDEQTECTDEEIFYQYDLEDFARVEAKP